MNQTFTLTQLTEFTLREKQLLDELCFHACSLKCPPDICRLPQSKVEFNHPTKHVVDFLLNYSKALSVRKSKLLGAVDMVLN